MKKSIVTIASLFFMVAAFAGTPGDKVLRIFNETFNNPKEATWSDFEDYYNVRFVQGGITSTVKYDKEGNFISAIRYYAEENLPINIVCDLKKQYAGNSIFGVTEVSIAGKVYYFVKLEGEKNWLTVKIGNGYMSTIEKLKKS